MSEEVTGDAERRVIVLTEEQMELIAEKAAEKVFDRIYSNVGKSVVHKLLKLAGLVVIGIALYLAGRGQLPEISPH